MGLGFAPGGSGQFAPGNLQPQALGQAPDPNPYAALAGTAGPAASNLTAAAFQPNAGGAATATAQDMMSAQGQQIGQMPMTGMTPQNIQPFAQNFQPGPMSQSGQFATPQMSPAMPPMMPQPMSAPQVMSAPQPIVGAGTVLNRMPQTPVPTRRPVPQPLTLRGPSTAPLGRPGVMSGLRSSSVNRLGR